jgi:nucleoid DNA-binding protein
MATKAKAKPKKVAKKATTTTTLRAIKNAWTRSEIVKHISELTELTAKDVKAVLDEQNTVLIRHLMGTGTFTIPGVAKFSKQRKPARKARPGVNPFTGEEIMIKAKPAHNVVKARILKKLKDEVA